MCICLCLHLCITVIYLSIPLEVSVSGFLSVVFSFNFLHFLNLFPISWILLSTLFSFNLEKHWESYLYTVLYLTSSVTTANSQTSCISNSSLVKEDRNPPLPPSLSFYEKDTGDGNSNANGCHCSEFLFIRYLISITLLIPNIFYLEGLNHYIPSFYRRGEWDPTWSYG